MPARRGLLALAVASAAVIAGGALFTVRALDAKPQRRADAARLMNELMSGKPVGAPFTLTDVNGAPVALADFRGTPVLLYFGFTYCPDVCPTDLAAIADAVNRLDTQGLRVQPLFVTLDPARDTREALARYTKAFHPNLIALTGSESEIRQVATSYKVFFEKVPLPGSATYSIDHAALTFVLDREGRYVGALPGGTTSGRIVEFVREVM